MNLRRAMALSTCGIAASILAACLGGGSGADISARNSGFFLGRVDAQTMQGAFNPAGFEAAQVRSLVAETCQSGQLSGFSTQARSDGLVGFAATCDTWKNGARLVEYERSGGAGVVIEITGSVSGTLTYDRIETTV